MTIYPNLRFEKKIKCLLFEIQKKDVIYPFPKNIKQDKS